LKDYKIRQPLLNEPKVNKAKRKANEMAATPTSNYSSSPSPSPTTQSRTVWNSAFASTGGKMHLQRIQAHLNQFFTTTPSLSPSPTTHNPAEWETRSQWRFCPIGEDTYNPLYRTPSPPPSTQSTPEWCKDDSPEGGRVYTPGLYDEDRDDEIPDIATLRVTDNEEEEEHVFRTPPPNHTHTGPHCCLLSPPPPPPSSKTTQTQTQHTTQTPSKSQSSNEKRHKKMTDIANNVEPEAVALAWMFMGIYVRNSSVAETLRTGFNLKPSLKEVFEIQSEIETEFKKAMRGLINHGSYYKGSGSNFCFINFMRDMMEIPELAMIRMRRVLAECKCCAHHQSRRPLCQEKKRLQMLLPSFHAQIRISIAGRLSAGSQRAVVGAFALKEKRNKGIVPNR